PQRAYQRDVQSTPVQNHQDCSNDRERIGGRGVIENSCHSFHRGQESFPPYLGQSRPSPLRQGSNLAQLQVRPVPDGRESDKLKDEVAKSQDGECDPDALVTAQAVKTVTESLSHGGEEHHQRVPTPQPEPAENPSRGLPVL